VNKDGLTEIQSRDNFGIVIFFRDGALPGRDFRRWDMRGLQNVGFVVAGVCLALFAGSFVSGADDKAAEKPGTVTLKVATPQQYAATVKAQKGKVVLVDFWGTYCTPCREKFGHTVAISRKYAARGLTVISMACDEEENHKDALAFLTRQKATFINLRAAKGTSDETWDAYEIDSGALPHYKLYDRTGKLRHTFTFDAAAKKQFTSDDVEAKVRSLIEEK
jgi:thiol-disulfide isomerase/thioredoxin